MVRTCRKCRRVNPGEAAYCYHDGALLDGHDGGPADVGSQLFTAPFVLPTGRSCRNFKELAVALHDDPENAHRLFHRGHLETFLGAQGRTDLADAAHAAAHAAARTPEREQALDEFLERLPGAALRPARLHVEPTAIDLGTVRPGEDRRTEVVLRNEGARLLSGSATCGAAAWVALGDGPPLRQKLFQINDKIILPVRVIGRQLGARNAPQETTIRVETNGGTAEVRVRLFAPVRPFPEGVLAGATSPRQLAEKAREAQNEAAVLIASGAVARWYESNGWVYPVAGPTATGPAAVQQLFEALGLARPPRLELGEESVELRGRPGEKVEYVLSVVSQENRPAVAHGASDQPWLHVGAPVFRGRSVFLPLLVAAVPMRPGETLQAVVSIIANGGKRFTVPVRLAVGARTAVPPPPVVPLRPAAALPPAVQPPPVAVLLPPVVPPPAPVAPPPRAPLHAPTRPVSPSRSSPTLMFALAGLLLLALLAMAGWDYFRPEPKPPTPPVAPPDDSPRLEIRFHDAKKDDVLEKLWFPDSHPSMRFGLVMLQDGKPVGDGAGVRRLTFDPWGRTDNVCIRFGKTEERLFGGGPGHWEAMADKGWKDDQGKPHDGVRSVWVFDGVRVRVTQFVELVRGEQSGLLDTCRVRYRLENQDNKVHTVGARFLLDTFIGGNDGVPFTIPGDAGLCDTLKDLPSQARDKKVPDFLQALEKPDLAHPGTVAHLRLKLEGLEPPSRVTLGAWPNRKLGVLDQKANGPATLWDVPLASMKSLGLDDSAITMYWPDEPLPPGKSREVGFEYGLWNLAGKGGRLAATVDGAFRPDGQLTVVAYVAAAGGKEDETLTLSLPPGFDILEGDKTQAVPRPPPGAKAANLPVTWKVKAGPVGKYEFKVESSAGPSQPLPVEIKQQIFN